MIARRRFQGAWTIVRFNWPFYLGAAVVLVLALTVLAFALPRLGQAIAVLAAAGTLWFLAGSLGASHLVYDRSDLYRWRWLERLHSQHPFPRAVLCHSGFDEVSVALRERFPRTVWTVIDHFDEATMSEPSIRRARRIRPPAPGTLAAPFDRWPVADASAEAIFGLLAIHELRTHDERRAWFAEAARCLTQDGRIVIAEHVRDAANFIAFGPGFLHFHAIATWRASWESAGLQLEESFRITPFVRLFILRLPHPP